MEIVFLLMYVLVPLICSFIALKVFMDFIHFLKKHVEDGNLETEQYRKE